MSRQPRISKDVIRTEITDEEVLIEEIEYVIDTVVEDRIVELLWSRAIMPEGWVLFDEHYANDHGQLNTTLMRFVRRRIPLHDAFAARTLFEGLKARVW